MRNPISPYVLLIIAIIVFAITPLTYGADCQWTTKYDRQIQKSWRRNASISLPGIDWRYHKALMIQESSLNPEAQAQGSSAYGLGQLTDDAWMESSRRLNLRNNRRNWKDQIAASADYLANSADFWLSPRPVNEKFKLGLQGYFFGNGNLYKMQLYSGMELYLINILPYADQVVSGATLKHGLEYVPKIEGHYQYLVENCEKRGFRR